MSKLKAIYGTDQLNPSALTDVDGLKTHRMGLEVKRRHLARKVFLASRDEFKPIHKLNIDARKFFKKIMDEEYSLDHYPEEALWSIDLSCPMGITFPDHIASVWKLMKGYLVNLHNALNEWGNGSSGGFVLAGSAYLKSFLSNMLGNKPYVLDEPEFKKAKIDVLFVTMPGLPFAHGFVLDRHPAIVSRHNVCARIKFFNVPA